MLKIALCEDNKIQHNQIVSFIETISMPKHTLNSFYKGNDLFTSIQEAKNNKEPYDIVIMDIDLPDGNGIKFSKKIITNMLIFHPVLKYRFSSQRRWIFFRTAWNDKVFIGDCDCKSCFIGIAGFG